MTLLSRSPLGPLMLVASLATLAGCGAEEPTADALGIGVLTDSPIQGIEYLTTSNLGGTTNSAGEFRYKPGDTVIFRLGALPLGIVTGSGGRMTVTPIQLIEGTTAITNATDRQNAVTNLLVLLQSLDVDGNPGNGIRIPGAAVSALQNVTLASAIDLKAAPATFAASPELTTVVAAINTAGGSAAVVSPATALAHFQSQFLDDLAGSYYGMADGALVSFRFRSDGSYLMGDIMPASGGGEPGLERGSLTWNPVNGYVDAVTSIDTNGAWGLSAVSSTTNPLQLSLDGGDLIMTVRNASGVRLGSYRLSRLDNAGSGIGGGWVAGSAASLAAPYYLFLPNGQYILLDPVSSACGGGGGGPGVELGSYQVGSGLILFSNALFDTNGCNGAHDTDSGAYDLAPLSINSAAGSMLWGSTLEGTQLLRPDNSAD